MRVRLTIDRQRKPVQHHSINYALTLHELGLWAKERFALPHAPSVSNVSQLLKRFRAHPEPLQPCQDTNVPASKISSLLEEELLVWIEECGQRGICITGHLIRLKTERVWDELVASSVSATTRCRLLELTFSKGWLYNFERHHNLKIRPQHSRIADYEAKVVVSALLLQSAHHNHLQRANLREEERHEAFDYRCGSIRRCHREAPVAVRGIRGQTALLWAAVYRAAWGAIQKHQIGLDDVRSLSGVGARAQ
uniref:AlNc14C101G6030 protein n=1 Tax=Albugo laibachii Nc14 TaxID=890382 RepID=F0WHG7_9STRA|nr:AlNc14C101G6030 [Albugo laibachii Nc14]|eukprot:CCA20686.1 AlNc14C101G6030 [Albugo laibachii Nc14]